MENSIKEKNPDLTELLDPAYPLLQKFRELCPGTFKHSQEISLMTEAVAIALGIDPLAMKIAALYHDIGKMFNPIYFTENQLEGDNPHDKLEPFVSYNIITRHISDSTILLVNIDKFPRKIIEAISQHHGTTVVRYFHKKSGVEDENVFRYRCTKPRFVESAILMLCDQLEAKSRSLFQAGKLDVKIIDDVTNYLITDGQFDDVIMRLGDLKKIKETLGKEIEGLFQKRVDYEKAGKE